MRFFYILVMVVVLLTITINFSPNLKVEQDTVVRTTAKYDVAALKLKHGESRSFNHSQTRHLYQSILKDAEKAIIDLDGDFSESERAKMCSIMRANARKYARLRDSMTFSNVLLQIRDSYVHALRFLPLAAQNDVRDALRTGKPTVRGIGMTFKQAFACLSPTLSSSECPSYTFLKEVRGKSDRDILHSCTVSNKAYDAAYSM